jgi:hypothetical protein
MISLRYTSTGVAMLRLASQRLNIGMLMRVMIIVMEVRICGENIQNCTGCATVLRSRILKGVTRQRKVRVKLSFMLFARCAFACYIKNGAWLRLCPAALLVLRHTHVYQQIN